MIIELLLDAIFAIFSFLLSFINIPPFPPEANEYINTFISYVTAGAEILANYTPYTYLLVLFGVVVAVDIGVRAYHFVMWIIRKIPMVGIS